MSVTFDFITKPSFPWRHFDSFETCWRRPESLFELTSRVPFFPGVLAFAAVGVGEVLSAGEVFRYDLSRPINEVLTMKL